MQATSLEEYYEIWISPWSSIFVFSKQIKKVSKVELQKGVDMRVKIKIGSHSVITAFMLEGMKT